MPIQMTSELELRRVCGNVEEAVDSGKRAFALIRKGPVQSETSFIVVRHSNCDFCLDSTDLPCFISRQHAKLTICGCQVYITDLQSVNGTFLNDMMLEPFVKTELNIDDNVTFGCVSPDAVVTPGTTVTQENPLFKFILKQGQGSHKDGHCINHKRPSKAENSHLHKVHCDSLKAKDDGDVNSPTNLCNDCSSASTSLHCSIPSLPKTEESSSLTPKLRAKLQYAYVCQNTSETAGIPSKDEPVPLTVRNLIAFSGCDFKDIQISSDEKENQNLTERTATNGSFQSKTKRKRKRNNTFTKTKRRKKDQPEDLCAFSKCKVKHCANTESSNVVSWVQCDYCDKWYHTECVGCDYNTVKSTARKFRCGLC